MIKPDQSEIQIINVSSDNETVLQVIVPPDITTAEQSMDTASKDEPQPSEDDSQTSQSATSETKHQANKIIRSCKEAIIKGKPRMKVKVHKPGTLPKLTTAENISGIPFVKQYEH